MVPKSESLAKSLFQEPSVQGATTECLRKGGFLQQLAAGTLPRSNFQGYIFQDKFFLENFARAYAFALAYSPDLDGIQTFARLISGVMDELKVHHGFAAKWGVDMESKEWQNVQPSKVCQAYCDFLLHTARHSGSVSKIAAACAPCMVLYAHLGRTLKQQTHATEYSDWIDTYGSDEFAALAEELEDIVDKFAEKEGVGREELLELYETAMRLEVDFFNAWA